MKFGIKSMIIMDDRTNTTQNKADSGNQNLEISRRGFLRAARNAAIGGVLFSLVGWRYAGFERGWLKTNYETFEIKGLPAVFSGLRIIHLSDFHFNDWMTPFRFEEVVTKVNQEDADLILITGDIVDRRVDFQDIPAYVELLAQLNAPMGKFAVLGNHDHWHDVDMVRGMLLESDIEDLSNRVVKLNLGSEEIYLCGLDSSMDMNQDMDKVLAELPEEGTALLMIHEPDYADISASYDRFALQLSGHSHGGQVFIPLLGPPITPHMGHKYPRGRYQIGDMHLYTSSGIGMIEPYIRINCRPEVAVITLESI